MFEYGRSNNFQKENLVNIVRKHLIKSIEYFNPITLNNYR